MQTNNTGTGKNARQLAHNTIAFRRAPQAMFPLVSCIVVFPVIFYLTPSPYLRFLSFTGVLFATGWSWLQREGRRLEEEAEHLRRVRNMVAGEDKSERGATTWREVIGDEKEYASGGEESDNDK